MAIDVDLQGCIRGDEAAWGRFVERCSGIIVAAVSRTLGRTPGEIDDPVQEVFVRLLKDDCRLLRTFDPGRASLATWLTLVSRSVAIDHVRRRRPTAGLDGTELPVPEPATPPTGPELPMHLLSARQRLVLTMLFDEEMTVPETARILGVDEQTVRSTKHKALKRLRDHLAAESTSDRPDEKPSTHGDAGRRSAV